MKLNALAVATGIAILALVASTSSFAHSKAELDASADRALHRFFALNPANRDLAKKAAGILVFSHVAKGGAGVAGEYGNLRLLQYRGSLRRSHARLRQAQ